MNFEAKNCIKIDENRGASGSPNGDKINEKDETVLEWGREKRWRGGEHTVEQDFLRSSDW